MAGRGWAVSTVLGLLSSSPGRFTIAPSGTALRESGLIRSSFPPELRSLRVRVGEFLRLQWEKDGSFQITNCRTLWWRQQLRFSCYLMSNLHLGNNPALSAFQFHTSFHDGRHCWDITRPEIQWLLSPLVLTVIVSNNPNLLRCYTLTYKAWSS